MYNDNKKKILNAVKKDASALQYVGADLMSDKEFILEAMNQNGLALEYGITYSWFLGCIKYKIDYREASDVVLAAVKQNGRALEHASKELQGDKQVVLAAVNQNGRALKYASPRLKKDKEVVMEAVKRSGRALWYASDRLKNDREVVLAAVNQDGWALQYADANLRKDKEVVLAAVNQDGWALEYAHTDLRKDKEFILKMVNQDGISLKYADISLQNDIDVVFAALKTCSWALEYAHADLQNNKEVVLAALKKSDLAFQYAHPDLKKDKEFILKLLNPYWQSIRFVEPSLRDDKEVVMAAVKQSGWALGCLLQPSSSNHLWRSKEVTLEAVKQNGRALQFACPDLLKDKEFFKTHIIENLEPKNMIIAYDVFIKYANDLDINDVLLAIYNKSQGDERYLNEIIEYYRSDDCSEEVKELLNQNMGPDLWSLMQEDKSDQLSGRFVSGITEKPMESKEVKCTHFNNYRLSQLDEYLSDLGKHSFLTALLIKKPKKGMAQNGCQKIVDFINTKISHQLDDNMKNDDMQQIAKAIEEDSIEVIRLFLKVASTEDKDSMNELIKTLLSTDQVAREYFEKNADKLAKNLKEAVFPDISGTLEGPQS